MFTHAQGVKEPSRHAFRSHLAGQDKTRQYSHTLTNYTELVFSLQHNNEQQEAIN